MRFGLGLLVLFFSMASFAFEGYPVIPDQKMTPGSLCSSQDRDFDGYRYREKVPHCRRDVSRGLKNRIYSQYGIPQRCRRSYTVDHFYPLSMGGNNSSKNLWPEHRLVKQLRFDLEQEVFDRLQEGRITQEEALETIYNAKMNPPVDELEYLLSTYGRGGDCDRAAIQYYRSLSVR